MKAKSYVVLQRAVEEGVAFGWNWAHKYVDNPAEEKLKDDIAEAVMNAISEVFTFEEVE